MARHQSVGARHPGQPGAAVLEFVHEREGACGIVFGDPFTDLKKIGLRLIGKTSFIGREYPPSAESADAAR
jgi:hypothetical protein